MTTQIVRGGVNQVDSNHAGTHSPAEGAESVEVKDGDLYCLCGNDPNYYGFFPCDRQGQIIEPVAGKWDELYVCTLCSRIMDIDTATVVGVAGYPAVQAGV